MRLRRRLLSFFFSAAALCAIANAAPWQTPIRIGYVTFDLTPAQSETDLWNYLRSVAAKGSGSSIEAEPRFQLYRGNYYQVVSWLHHGDLDGAVLSPFTAFVLSRQLPDEIYPAVELAGSVDTAIQGGSRPHLIVRRYDGSGRETVINTPLAEYDRFLRALWRSTTTSGSDEADIGPFEVDLVNHLSTSGFVLPLAYTHQRLHDIVGKQGKPLDETTLHRGLERFWNLYFQYVHLTLLHGSPSTASGRRNVTVFTFKHAADTSAGWQSYVIGNAWPSNPNDVLVFRVNSSNPVSPADPEIRSLLQSDFPPLTKETIPNLAAGLSSPFRLGAGGMARGWTSRSAPLSNDRLEASYRTAAEYNQEAQSAFANRVRALFGLDDDNSRDYCTKPLHALWVKWYEDRQYEFTVDELFQLLMHDGAARTGSAEGQPVALVLPGGGVRGVYQAALLDQLYDNSFLANERDSFHRGHPKLVVEQVIGTSGGALVGYFAAQRLARVRGVLRQQWIRDGDVIAGPLKIVPFFGLPRWLSVLLIFGIFAAISALTFGDALLVTIPSGDVPVHIPVAILLAVGSGPLLLWHLAAVKQDYTPTWEGLLYLIVILIAHFLLTTTSPRAELRPRRLWNIVALALAGLYGVMVTFIFMRDDRDLLANGMGLGLQSAQAFIALIAVLAAAFCYTIPRGMMAGRAVRAYLKGVFAALVVIVIAFVVVCCGIAIDAASWLELTWEYWIWVVAGAVIAATFVCGYVHVFGHAGLRRYFGEAVMFWSELHTERRLLRTPAQSLMALATFGIVLWVVFAAPALYSGSEGRRTFGDLVEEFNHGRDQFSADFVVTASALGTHLANDAKSSIAYAAGRLLLLYWITGRLQEDHCGQDREGHPLQPTR